LSQIIKKITISWDNIVTEVEDHIAQEELWMDEESPWRENPSEVPAGSYCKE